MRSLFIAVVLAVLAGACPAQPPDPMTDPTYVSDTIFPESRGWTLLSSTPSLSAEEFAGVKTELQRAFRASDEADSTCRFADLAFDKPDVSAFHRVDIDHDGINDIVYTNQSVCGEGDDSVIWHGTAKGYVVEPGGMWSARIVRFAPDGKGIASVQGGCCGDDVDRYIRGDLHNPSGDLNETQDVNRQVPVVDETPMPSNRYAHAMRFKAPRSLRVRTHPRIDDAYNADDSEFLRKAAFGNVARIYLPSSAGAAVGEKTVAGRRWLFVVMDAGSDQLASNDPYDGVTAGWVLAKDVVLAPLPEKGMAAIRK